MKHTLVLALGLFSVVASAQSNLVNGRGGGITDQSAFLTALGGTNAGKALFQLPNPSAVAFPRVNADNTASLLSASEFRTAIGLGNVEPTAANLTFAADTLMATRRLRSTLDRGVQSCSMLVIGDSMSDDNGTSTTTGAWPSQLCYRFAASYPNYNVVRRLWDGSLTPKRYVNTVIQTGPSGARRIEFDSNNQFGWTLPTMATPVVGNIDVRIQFSVASWAALSSRACLVQEAGAGGSRFSFWTSNSKQLAIDWISTAGSNPFNRVFASTSMTVADGATIWARVTMEGNVSGSNVCKFYTSTDGVSWTQLGTTRTNGWQTGVQSAQLATGSASVGGNTGFSEPIVGANVFAVEVLDGVDGKIRNNRCLDDMTQTFGSNRNRIAGSPTLVIANASSYGFTLNDWLGVDSGLMPWVQNDGPGIVVLAQGYNNVGTTAATVASLDSLKTAVRARRPYDQWIVTIEPFCSIDTVGRWVGNMQKRGTFYDWARENNAGVIDIHTVFRDLSGSDSTLTYFVNNPGGGDVGIHPNGNGQILWADSFITVFNR